MISVISVLTINFLENTKSPALVFGLIRNDLLFYSSAGALDELRSIVFEQTDNNACPKWQSSQVRAKCYSGNIGLHSQISNHVIHILSQHSISTT